ncbi:unnamed protein product [Leptosia nina]|uniref:Uncharacterized protein n=1 Tax=Leptosia nina TaxID=320188 RepID=A0AAV1K3K4_9NEOP
MKKKDQSRSKSVIRPSPPANHQSYPDGLSTPTFCLWSHHRRWLKIKKKKPCDKAQNHYIDIQCGFRTPRAARRHRENASY